MHDGAVSGSSSVPAQQCCAFTIMCGLPAIEQLFVARLVQAGFYHDPHTKTLVLIDVPYGFALVQLESLAHMQHCIIVITSSPCPEYWEDVWDHHPAILLVNDCLYGELEGAIIQAACGERYRLTPQHTSQLTPCERAALRYVARGESNQQIANTIGVSPKHVANTLTGVYGKLQLDGRGAAILYYWGLQACWQDKVPVET